MTTRNHFHVGQQEPHGLPGEFAHVQMSRPLKTQPHVRMSHLTSYPFLASLHCWKQEPSLDPWPMHTVGPSAGGGTKHAGPASTATAQVTSQPRTSEHFISSKAV
jgi:hypothetical protein